MRKLKFLKTLLVVATLLVGGSNAWANDTFGSLESGWWTDFSQDYLLEDYGTYSFTFTTTNANDGNTYKNWLVILTNGANSHGGGGSEYGVLRGDAYAWGQGKNSNTYNADTNADGDPTRLNVSNTYAANNPSGAGIQSAMNGATVNMTVTRKSTNIYVVANVTPTTENPFNITFNYLFGNATSENVGIFFTVQNATMDISSAEQTQEFTKIYTNDYETAATISDLRSGDYRDCQITDGSGNHYLKIRENGRNGGSGTMTLPSYSTNDYQEFVLSFSDR